MNNDVYEYYVNGYKKERLLLYHGYNLKDCIMMMRAYRKLYSNLHLYITRIYDNNIEEYDERKQEFYNMIHNNTDDLLSILK